MNIQTQARVCLEIGRLKVPSHEVLVSVDGNGEARWGEVVVLPRETMKREMVALGYLCEGMLTGEEFLDRYLEEVLSCEKP